MIKPTVNELLANPDLYNEDNFYGFYDWFCRMSSLKNKYHRQLIPKLRSLVNDGIIDGDKVTVWFKNNCPGTGSLYDDIRFNRASNDVYIGGICPSSGHTIDRGTASYWLASEDFESHEFQSFSALKKYMKAERIRIE